MKEGYISLKDLKKKYGSREVLKGVSFDVEKGEFLTLYGPNGAGKTTLLMILSTLIRPSGGSLSIGGMFVGKDNRKIRGIIGYMGHADFLYENLTAFENLDFYSSLYGIPNKDEKINYLLDLLDLNNYRESIVRTFSKGMKRRLSIARSLIHSPDIILFDEPFSGLDASSVKGLREIIKELKEERKTFIVATHNVDYVSDITDRIVVMKDGTIEGITTSAHNIDLQNCF